MKTTLILLLTIFSSFVNPEESEKVRIKNFELEIPAQLEKAPAREKYNELLSLRYKSELKIIIADDIGSPLKTEDRKKTYEMFDLLTETFKVKYEKWYNTYKGYEKGKLRKDNINSFKARTRDFKANISGMKIYFEISTINIGNYYFDIIVTGKEDSRSSHKTIVNELVNSIKKTSEE